MAEFETGMTVYDFLRSEMSKQTPLTTAQKQVAVDKIAEYFSDGFKTKGARYFLLLCNERRYYTVFHLTSMLSNFKTAAAECIACCLDNGVILSVDVNEDNVYEIWIKNRDGEVNCYHLFDYTAAVIEI